MILSFRDKFSSRVDYPQEDLPSDLWNKEDGYVLQPNAEKSISNMVEKVLSPFKKMDKWIDTYLLGSSIVTQFWKKDSDLDVKIVIHPNIFKQYNPEYKDSDNEKLKEQFLKIFDSFKGKDFFKFGKRPFDLYLVIDSEVYTSEFQKRFDGLYDVKRKQWIKNPEMFDIDSYDRDAVVEKGEELALQWASKWDSDLGKIRRKVKEFELVNNYIKNLPPKKRLKFKTKIENLLLALQKDINTMHSQKEQVKDQYHKAYDDFDENLENYYGSVNAAPEVIRMKLLNLWGYVYIIKNLNKITEDQMVLDKHDVKDIKQVLKHQIE